MVPYIYHVFQQPLAIGNQEIMFMLLFGLVFRSIYMKSLSSSINIIQL